MKQDIYEKITNEIIEEYRRGASVKRLTAKYGIATYRLMKMLRDAGLNIRTSSPRAYTSHQKTIAIARYREGVTISVIAKELRIDSATIRYLLASSGQRMRTQAETMRIKHPYREDAFDECLPEALYWLGFLMADGCVTEGNRVTVSCHSQDKDHLWSFRRFMGATTHVISPVKNQNVYAFGFGGKHIADRLRSLGLVERKSLIAVAAPELAASKFFWLGEIDGDGTLVISTNSRRPIIELVGSKRIIEQFADFLGDNLGWRPNPNKVNNIWRVSVFGARAVELARLLWEGHSLGLPRKRKLAEDFIQQFSYLKLREKTSGFDGVYKITNPKKRKMWIAQCGKRLRSFDREIEAAFVAAAYRITTPLSQQAEERRRA